MNNVVYDEEKRRLILSNSFYSPFSRRVLDDFEKLRICSNDAFYLLLTALASGKEDDPITQFIKDVYSDNRKYVYAKDYIGEAISNAYTLINILGTKIYSANYEEYGIDSKISIGDIFVNNIVGTVSFYVNYIKTKLNKSDNRLFTPLHIKVTVYLRDTCIAEMTDAELINFLTDDLMAKTAVKKGSIQYNICVENNLNGNELNNLKLLCEELDLDIIDYIQSDMSASIDNCSRVMCNVLKHVKKSNQNIIHSELCVHCAKLADSKWKCDPLYIEQDSPIDDEMLKTLKENFNYRLCRDRDRINSAIYVLRNDTHSDLFEILNSPKWNVFTRDALKEQLELIECLSNNGSIYTNENKGVLKH